MRSRSMKFPSLVQNGCRRCSYDGGAGRAEVDNAVTNCVFLFSGRLISLAALPPITTLLPALVALVSRLAPSPGSGGPSLPPLPVSRKVNWLCCVFRRLHNDDGTGGTEGDHFLNFLRTSTCSPSAIST